MIAVLLMFFCDYVDHGNYQEIAWRLRYVNENDKTMEMIIMKMAMMMSGNFQHTSHFGGAPKLGLASLYLYSIYLFSCNAKI